jgi:hypothetical protein
LLPDEQQSREHENALASFKKPPNENNSPETARAVRASILTDAEPPDDPGAGDGGPDHRDAAAELGIEHTARMPCQGQNASSDNKLLVRGGPGETDRPVEALGGAGRDEAVGVGEPREDAHLARVLELDACMHTDHQEE